MDLQSILTQNQQVQSRQETLDNIIYSVFPVVMLTEGVHAGSGGPVLYTAQTLANFHQTWNGTPVTLKHPDLNGTPVSANNPEIYKNQVIGTVFNTTFQDNKLKAELWLNEQKLEMLAPGLLNGLRVGMKLDVSTGLFDEGPKVTGNFNGQDYVAVAHNIRPDHLALLPGETGACSWKDGCGVRANAENIANKEGKEVKSGMRRTRFATLGGPGSGNHGHGGRPGKIGGSSSGGGGKASGDLPDPAKFGVTIDNGMFTDISSTFRLAVLVNREITWDQPKVGVPGETFPVKARLLAIDEKFAYLSDDPGWAKAAKQSIRDSFSSDNSVQQMKATNGGFDKYLTTEEKKAKKQLIAFKEAVKEHAKASGEETHVIYSELKKRSRPDYKPPKTNQAQEDEMFEEFIKQEEALIPLAFTLNFGEESIQPSENKAKDPQSYQGIMDALRAALYPNDINGEVYHYIRAAYPDYIVYERESKHSGTKLFKKEYKMMDGKVEWTSEPTEVQQEITYKEIQTNSNQIEENEENEMKTMRECCPAKVDELIKANAKFQETDKEMLLNMSEDAFARVIDLSAPEVKVVEKIVEKEVKVNAESKTFDELLANADPKLQESIQHGQRLVAQERLNLVSRIKTNKANAFSDDELAKFDLDMLGKLAAMAPAQVNWAGNGGARQVTNSETVEPLPELEDAWKEVK